MTEKRSDAMIEALSALIGQQPFFASLMLDLMVVRECDSTPHGTQMPTAATDGRTIYVNPEFFKKLTVQERIFVLAHEVTHVILQHPDRMRKYLDLGVGPDLKPWSHPKYNHAADYVINAYLTEIGCGKLPIGGLINPQITSAELVDDIYCKIPDPPEDPESQGWDRHMPSSGDPLDKATIQRSVAQAATAQKSRGTLPAGLQRLVDEILEPQVKWQDHLRRTIVTLQGSDQQTWARPNRRRLAVAPHIYWPGRCGTRSGNVGVELDMSGSVGEEETKIWIGEVGGMLSDVAPEKIYLMYVDAALCGDVHELTDISELRDVAGKAQGGGGTDMTVIFRELEERHLEVEYVIVLTDGYTPFGEDVGIPTIWCITTPGIEAPWGTTIHVTLNGQR